MSYAYQPRGRGRGGWRGNRGRGRGGQRFGGRGRGRGKGSFIQPTAAWNILEQCTTDYDPIFCKLTDNKFIAMPKRNHRSGGVISNKNIHHFSQVWSVYDVKSNTWNQLNVDKSQYKLIDIYSTCVNDKMQEVYIHVHYVTQSDCELLQSDHEAYEQYKMQQTQQLDVEWEQKLQQDVRNMYGQTLSQETMQQYVAEYRRSYKSSYDSKLQMKLSEYTHKVIQPNAGIFKFDVKNNKIELFEMISQQFHHHSFKLFVMNNILHKFTYGASTKLMKWDKEASKFIIQQEYKQFIPNSMQKQFAWFDVIVCKEQNVMVLMSYSIQQERDPNKRQGYKQEYEDFIQQAMVYARILDDVYTLNLNHQTMDKVTVKVKIGYANSWYSVCWQNFIIMIESDRNKKDKQEKQQQQYMQSLNPQQQQQQQQQQHINKDRNNYDDIIWVYNIEEKQIRKSKIKLTSFGEPFILNNTMHLINHDNHFAMELKHIIPPYWLNKTYSISDEKQMKHIQRNKQKQAQQSINIKLSKIENMVNKMNTTLTMLTSSVNKIRNDVTLLEQKQKRDKSEIISMINSIKNEDMKEDNTHVNMVKEWLTCFGLDRYYECFVSNGYESLEFIKGIESKQELFEIGIKLKGHQTQIMVQINKLKQPRYEVEGQNVINTQ
eukprot:347089_1